MIVCKVFATPKRKDIEPANMQGCWLFINLFKIKGIIFLVFLSNCLVLMEQHDEMV